MRLLIGLLFLHLAIAVPAAPKAPVCGYESCPVPQASKLNVHLVAHSHQDVGWLQTVDEYYYGKNQQQAGVQYILDSVVAALLQNPERKFIYVETAFFWKWWVEQTPEMQDQVKGLVNNGQLEFISGGWSMNDEAAPHYQPTIDQFTYGHRKLNDTFGTCGQPRVGWQVDPFGHSKEQASLMAQYYFDGLFFGRFDYQDMNKRLADKSMEMIWEASPSLGDLADLYTHCLYNLYDTPPGFCWDVHCSDEPIIDNPDLPDYNVDDVVQRFLDFVNKQRLAFRTNNIIVLFGDDFQYMSALRNYKNIDKLIRYVNEADSDVNLFYSTPSCYLKSINDAGIELPTKQDDFFPFASGATSFWTAYFTGRPTLKYFERQGNNILQAAKQLTAVTGANAAKIEPLQAAVGVLQHHDAIAGTEVLFVAKDYARQLDAGIVQAEAVIAEAVNSILKTTSNSPTLEFDSCRLRNISECAVSSEKDAFLVTIYNPLSMPVDYYVRLPVRNGTYSVQAPNGTEIVSQVLPIPEHVTRIPGRTSTTLEELLFFAQDLPPLGYRSYYVSRLEGGEKSSRVWTPAVGETVSIGNEMVKINLDPMTKLVQSITVKDNPYIVQQKLQYYDGAGTNAYILRPAAGGPMDITTVADTVVVAGDLVEEIHQVFSEWASQVVRIYFNSPYMEFEWLVGPVPTDDNMAKVIISKYTTDFITNTTFYTDTTGRDVLERRKDYRPTWDLEQTEPVGGNYYPIVTHISLNNSVATMAIVTDRAQGGTSLEDGVLELNIHTSVIGDSFQPSESIDQDSGTVVVRGKHHLLLDDSDGYASPKEVRLMGLRKVLDGLVLLSDVNGQSQEDVAANYNLEFTPIANPLPEQVHILTLEPWKDGSLLLRLEHIFSIDEDPTTVTVDLTTIFSNLQIVSARETTLSALKWLDEASRLQWQKEGGKEPTGPSKPSGRLAIDAIELAPKQIRTFVLEVATK